MNSQNRMNAGAEYVLYRILSALQDRKGIHAASLLTCLGALAGYACRHAYGDALNKALADSPLSVWALVARAVQKLDKPPPDLDDIFEHVAQTAGTRAFGIVRVPDEHRPRHRAIVYLEQLWPQILPIAEPFCRKRAQLPVLLGIALQRAIHITQDMLSPTLSARIAMESAVAMSKVALAGDVTEAPADPVVAQPAAAPKGMNVAPTPIAAALSEIRAEPRRTAPPTRRRRSGGDASARNVRTLIASVPPTTRIVTILSVAIISIAGTMWKSDRKETQEPVRVERKLQVAKVQDRIAPLFSPPTQDAQATPSPEASASPPPEPVQPNVDAADPITPQDAAELRMNEESQRQLDASATGSSEMLPSMDVAPSAPPPSAALTESLF